MDIRKFVQQRKRMGFSQAELCAGICTQSTLSKFENKGRVPSVKILEQLCQRLEMSLGELSEQNVAPQPHRRTVLDQAEHYLLGEQFPLAIKTLNQVRERQLTTAKARMQYYYLKGMIDTLTSNQTATTMFNFTQILDKLDEEHQTVFSQLAYLGCGILYARKNRLGNAEFFFTKVVNYLERTITALLNLADLTNTQYARLVMMCYYVAEYQALRKRLPDSNRTLARVSRLCAARYLTVFMPRVKLLAANNAMRAGATSETVGNLLSAALVFARFNGNSVVELQAAALKKQLTDL